MIPSALPAHVREQKISPRCGASCDLTDILSRWAQALLPFERDQRGRCRCNPRRRASRPGPARMGAIGRCRSPQQALAKRVDCRRILTACSHQPLNRSPACLFPEIFLRNQRSESRHPRTLAHAGTRRPSAIRARRPQDPIDAPLGRFHRPLTEREPHRRSALSRSPRSHMATRRRYFVFLIGIRSSLGYKGGAGVVLRIAPSASASPVLRRYVSLRFRRRPRSITSAMPAPSQIAV